MHGESVLSQVVNLILERSTIEQDEGLESLYQKCREGNPFPLIAHQWPSLLVTEPDEQKFFQGDPSDPENPCLRLDDWQRDDILKPFFDEAVWEIVIKGNTKPGKGASVAVGINLWFEVYDPAKIILTSATHQHAKNVIFSEVVKWRKEMTAARPCRVLIKSISDTEQHYVEISNPKTGEGFSGQHGPRTLFVFDESTAVPDRFHEDAGKQARKMVAIGNPRTLSGWFHRMYRPCGNERNRTQTVPAPMGLRYCVTVGGMDCMNVRHKRLEVPIAPPGGIEIRGKRFEESERIPPAYYREVKTLIPNQVDYARFKAIQSHPDPRHVAVFAHGHFPDEDPEKQVILSSWIPRHVEAHAEIWSKIKVIAFGLDVARSLDGDESVLTYGGKLGILGFECAKYADGPAVAKWVIDWVRKKLSIDLKKGRHPVTVDMDGIGVAAGDCLRLEGVWVIEFRGNARSLVDPKTYKNLRTEAYSTLGRRLNPDDRWRDEPFAMPDDGQTHEDLCAPEKIQIGGDEFRFKLTPKDEITSSLGRSPDRGDSFVYFYHCLRIVLDINEQFEVWEATSIVKDMTPKQEKEIREMVDDDHLDVSQIGVKKKDWAAGLSFSRADPDED